MASSMVHAQLVLVRHGESTYNADERFTGWRDVELTERGRDQARAAGRSLLACGLRFTRVFTSMLRRAIETADLLLQEQGQPELPREAHWRLNERHGGAMQGMTKDESYAAFGDAARSYRRSWHAPPPPALAGGIDDPRTDARYRGEGTELPLTESLRDLVLRVASVWQKDLLPQLATGTNVLVVGHGLALRALAHAIENIAAPELPAWRPASAAPRSYHLDHRLRVVSVTDLAACR